MPVWTNGRLEPRPFVLRVYLTRTGDGWSMMPGGFVRIGRGEDVHAISLQRGALTADAWIESEHAIDDVSLLPSPEHITIRRKAGTLPSRAADNLFWLGRYVDRTEATLRLVRALLNRDVGRQCGSAGARCDHHVAVGMDMRRRATLPTGRPNLVARAALQNREISGSVPGTGRQRPAAPHR